MQANSVLIGLGTLALTGLWAGKAHAYLDPGTGSMLLQAAVAGLAAAAFVVKTHWRRIKGWATGKGHDEGSPSDGTDPADAPE